MTFSDLSSPEPQHALDDAQQNAVHMNQNRNHYLPNPQRTEQEQLQSSLGIDESLVIADDDKIVYNYAAQQGIDIHPS